MQIYVALSKSSLLGGKKNNNLPFSWMIYRKVKYGDINEPTTNAKALMEWTNVMVLMAVFYF